MIVRGVKERIRLTSELVDRTGASEDVVQAKSRMMDCDAEEWFTFKGCVALAHAQDEISTDDALAIQSILGSTVDHFNGRTIAEKYVVCGVMAKLLEWKMALHAPAKKLIFCP